MNGLAQKWSDQVDFQDYDIYTPEGVAKRKEIGLRYLGYAILDPYGHLFWKNIGHSVAVEELEKQMEASLAVEPP